MMTFYKFSVTAIMVDGIIILVMLVFMISGYKKGLVREAIALVSTVISLILAVLAYPIMNMILRLLGIENWINAQLSRLNLEFFDLGLFKEIIGENLGIVMMNLLSIVILWFVIKLILRVALKLISHVIENLPIISSVNHLAGLVLGFFKGFLVLSIIAILIPFLMMSDLEIMRQLQSVISESYLIHILYQYNLAIWLSRYLMKWFY